MLPDESWASLAALFELMITTVCGSIIAQANKATVLQGTMDWNALQRILPILPAYSSKLAMNHCNEALYYADATALRPCVLCHGPSG